MKRQSKLPRVEEKPSPAVADGDAILQVKVGLAGISPMIWRRVLVPATFTLRELHGVIQVAMGWDRLEPEQFRTVFQRFMAKFSQTVRGVVAIDGKVLRRSFDRASSKSALHMVSAWGCEQRMVLAQIATDAKSNEITAVPKLLEMLSLEGTIVPSTRSTVSARSPRRSSIRVATMLWP
jgi:hypothetical protein